MESSAGGAEPAPRAPKQRPPHNLPLELTSFIGREREVAEVKRLIANNRLLTLSGPGGCGKTRLALAVASDLLEEFEDGVWWVGLASLSDPALVPQAVASALGVREAPGRSLSEVLLEDLRPKRLLLVLDNCEHLVDACAALADALLRSCPDVRILATSREALSIAGETTWLVPPLSLPDPDQQLSIEELARYEAVRLFLERAEAVASRFELTEENAPAMVRVCQRLDGMPLAIELAAARVRVLSVQQIASRLEDSFRLLATDSRTALPRQQTLRATIEWSHELLSEDERRLVRRLSVFAGGWTLEAAEEVCAREGIDREEVLDLLTRLVDKSLVLVTEQQQDGEETRYRLLETVRQYAREKLAESGEEPEARRRHADFYLKLAEKAEPELKGSQQVLWMQKLSTEHDNLRAAMRWLLNEGELETAARFGWALWLFLWYRGPHSEGRRWMEEALEKDSAMSARARAEALLVAGTMANGQADYGAAEALLGESHRLFQELGYKREAAYALGTSGFSAVGLGQPELAVARHEEAGGLFLEVGDKWAAVTEFVFSAVRWFKGGDRERAKSLAEQGLALAREVGDNGATSLLLYVLATVAHASGDYERATELFEEALILAVELGDETNIAYFLQGLAAVAASEGKVERAARLWGAAEALLEGIEITAWPHAPEPSVYESQVSAARARLNDEEAWEAAWAEGRHLTPEQAIEYALEASEPAAPPSTPPQRDTAGLSERELEVLRLVAEGLSDSKVAARLYLSPRTVGHHLSSIYRKLGVPSRAAAAKAAVERHLI